MTFVPPPVQRPRIPIWVVGAWPRPKSLRRALQWDGILPAKMPAYQQGSFTEMTPADIQELKTYIEQHRPPNLATHGLYIPAVTLTDSPRPHNGGDS